MSKDLDKAELLLEEYLDKINEQEQLIINLGEQCKEEKRIKESLFDQINENAVKSQLRQQPGEVMDISMSHLSQKSISVSNTSKFYRKPSVRSPVAIKVPPNMMWMQNTSHPTNTNSHE